MLFQPTRCHFLHCFLDSHYFSCQTNLYFVSSLAHGCNHPYTRLRSHSPQQTLSSFVSFRHPVSCLISPVFGFLTVVPLSSPPQSHCHLYLFINTILFLPHSPALRISVYCLGKSLREGQGQIIRTTGWAGLLPVVVMAGSVFLPGHSHRFSRELVKAGPTEDRRSRQMYHPCNNVLTR